MGRDHQVPLGRDREGIFMSIREIVVISGKGGTGKTTLAAALAASAGGRAVIADADVDAPNLALLLHPRETARIPFTGMAVAHVNEGLCTGCGLCEANCRYNTIHVRDGKARVDEGFCEGCRVCLHVCPEKCISLKSFERGNIRRGDTDLGPLWHGRLYPGGENTGLMVARLRKEARREAEESGAPLLITDGPPGIGCPVTSSVTGASFALLVTEPSLSALSDLRRAAELCRILGTPFGVAVNRWTLSEELTALIKDTCAGEGWPLMALIPFDERIALSVGAGRIPSEEMKEELAELWSAIYRTGRF
jgi:MinD superfamily P-loop ATPase